MTRQTVLIVDDEFGTVDALSAVLEDDGYVVLSAVNGRLALDVMRSSVPGVILLDVVMPVMGGPEFLKALRAEPRFEAVPVIIMSGLPESMVRRKTKAYQAFLRKPFGLDELVKKLKALTRARKR